MFENAFRKPCQWTVGACKSIPSLTCFRSLKAARGDLMPGSCWSLRIHTGIEPHVCGLLVFENTHFNGIPYVCVCVCVCVLVVGV